LIEVLLVDDHRSFRDAVAFMLDQEPDIRVVGQAGSVGDAQVALRLAAHADVAVIDLDLPDGDGAEVIKAFRAINRKGKVLVLSASSDPKDLGRAVEAGAAGILHKSCPISEIVSALRDVHAGTPLLSSEAMVDLLRFVGQEREQARAMQMALSRLTKREVDVLRCLAEGRSDRQIAERLHVSIDTVRTHMVNLLQKLGVDSRLQAVVIGVRSGIINIG
jgi:DNA-binding NarL/FixJ family response regulator